MKRSRETTTPTIRGKHYDATASSTTTAKVPPLPTKPKNSTLEEVRAKLEQARLKKIAAEERLLRQKQQQDLSRQPITRTPTTKQQSRAQEAQKALDRARSRFRALQNSNQPAWNHHHKRHHTVGSNGLPPISALEDSFELKITNIAQTGPPGVVYHQKDSVEAPFSTMGLAGSRAILIASLGGTEAVEALHRNLHTKRRRCRTNDEETAAAAASKTNAQKATSISLVQRKIQLQNELLALKEKLERKSFQEQRQKQQHQKNKDGTAATTCAKQQETKTRKIATKEGLERRKAEAQTVMDISYWKHFVSKQEHLLEQVTTKINDLDGRSQIGGNHHNSYKECLQKRHATNKAIAKIQQDLDLLEKRQQVVEEGMVHSTQKLLQARQALHKAKHNQNNLHQKHQP